MSDPQNNQPVFSIEKIYVKDLSLEIPNAPQAFLEREAPNVDIQLHHNSTSVEDGVYQTILTVTVTAKVAERTLFLVEVAQAGIFVLRNIPANDINMVLGVACPNILFPYAREVVSDVVVRAGFPPVVLNPVNFEALYQARIAPRRPVRSLTDAELDRLRLRLRAVVGAAVRLRADGDRFPRSWLFHRRWDRRPGITSRGEPIRWDTIAGRTTAWVPAVQR